ncbi:MAG: AAA family ATPase [Candidatus Hydrothermarchaeales archaeon]
MYNRVYLDVRKPRFDFKEIIGYEGVKEKLREMIVIPLKYPLALKRAGIKPPTGVIVWGPLGSGKGHMIEAAAGEAGVNYIIIRGRECTDHPNVIHEGFEFARENRPCVVHLMDIDWLAPRKNAVYTWGDGTESGKPDRFGSPEVRQAVYEEVKKVAPMEDIITAASAYRIDVVDQVFTRLGMLGRKIYVPRPNKDDRMDIFKFYLNGVKIAKDVDLRRLVDLTEYYVGWDIEALCRKAKLNAVERGKGDFKKVSMVDFEDAKEKVHAWLSAEMAREYDRIFREDCVHKYNF